MQALRKAGTDYVLAVKGNQRTLHRKVKAAFDAAEQGVCAPDVKDRGETVERNGGRRGRQHSVRYYISSRPPKAEALLALVRGPLGRRERVAPHPGRAVPGGRLPHAQGPRARRHGHPAPDRPEHGAHDSTKA